MNDETPQGAHRLQHYVPRRMHVKAVRCWYLRLYIVQLIVKSQNLSVRNRLDAKDFLALRRL